MSFAGIVVPSAEWTTASCVGGAPGLFASPSLSVTPETMRIVAVAETVTADRLGRESGGVVVASAAVARKIISAPNALGPKW